MYRDHILSKDVHVIFCNWSNCVVFLWTIIKNPPNLQCYESFHSNAVRPLSSIANHFLCLWFWTDNILAFWVDAVIVFFYSVCIQWVQIFIIILFYKYVVQLVLIQWCNNSPLENRCIPTNTRIFSGGLFG